MGDNLTRSGSHHLASEAAPGGYRSDIDGLRALAVSAVILSHTGVPGFAGGYVGVDVFFVISGYLITSILARDIDRGRYTIGDFYRRRILRIFPALTAMALVTTIASTMVLLPNSLASYGKSLAAAALFGSNILFWTESGYFAAEAHFKPLLHTWSLGIEEQFYILWPLLLSALGGGARRRRIAVALVISAASFAVASWWVLGSQREAAFFLLPARAWELGVGALLALYTPARLRGWRNEALSLVGLALIAFAIWRLTPSSRFPGPAALLPCIGAALLIWTGAGRTPVSRVLSLGPVVFVGRISYSLYLWHWPVIVFASVGLFLPPTAATILLEVAAAFILAVLSWRFIEQPFRSGRWPNRPVLLAGAGAIVASFALAAPLVATHGLPGRLTERQQTIAAWHGRKMEPLYQQGVCFSAYANDVFHPERCLTAADPAKPSVLIVGDSHAAHLWPGLSARRAELNTLEAARAGCSPVLYPAGHRCAAFMNPLLGGAALPHRPDVMLIAANWTEHMDDVPRIEATLRHPAVRASHPILIGPVPLYLLDLPHILAMQDRLGRPELAREQLNARSISLDREIRAIAARADVPYVSLTELFCGSGAAACRTFAAPGVPLYADTGHLTPHGSALAVARIMPAVRIRIAGMLAKRQAIRLARQP